MIQRFKHIILLIAMLAVMLGASGQRTRYVQVGSTHALSVPEHPGYSFEWRIEYGVNFNREIIVPSKTNVTQNIVWDNFTTYRVTVTPILDSVTCYGEPVSIDVITVRYLSLHTFDDIYFTTQNTPVSGNMGDNDLDETGANIYYNPTPVFEPKNGTVEILPDGTFTYTPNPEFTGTDQFVYEAYNDHSRPMYSNATVTIVVQNTNRIADLEVEKRGPGKELLGGVIEYELVVRNNGPNVAENAVVVDTLAFGLFKPTYSTGGAVRPWTGKLSIGNIAPGDSVLVYLFADVSEFSPRWVYNQAIAWSDTFDPNHVNNSSIWVTEISAIYVDLPGLIYLPSCETRQIQSRTESNNAIASFSWLPATGLSNPYVANPLFMPDEQTIGQATQYVLRITDVNGNVASDTTLIIVAPEPLAAISGDTLFKELTDTLLIRGNESFGDGLRYFWWTDNGQTTGFQNRDSLTVTDIGLYNLRVTDEVGCTAFDSVVVLLRSHPPVTMPDSVAIVAGTSTVLPNKGANYLALAYDPQQQHDYLLSLPDSVVNVLNNDYDRNNFTLNINSVVTQPLHSTYTWDQQGNFTIQPNAGFWGTDSLEYEVCNNGYPVQCSTAWVIVNSLRPPLNADVVIEKTGEPIAFWGDTVYFNLKVYNNGPDTANVTTITDVLNMGYYNPEFSINNGESWSRWYDSYIHAEPLRPGVDELNINIRAFVRLTADRSIPNKAFISTDILENVFENDTSLIITKIKEKVLAIAGPDTLIGACNTQLQLDASASTGENLTYRWTPASHLSNSNISQPMFLNPGVAGTYTYLLTITDDDGIIATDEIIITVLPPPVANAGPDRFLRQGDVMGLDGNNSTGVLVNYLWQTTDGHIVPGTQNAIMAVVDTIGTYRLTVTDRAGCTSTDEVTVYWFYHHPFAIPDYYSTRLLTPVSGNVLYNDYEPNNMFELSVTPGTYSSREGGTVVMAGNGEFTYTPRSGFVGVDRFTYNVCNTAVPPRCSRGYVQVTVNANIALANLSITKEPVQEEALIGLPGAVEFKITVENHSQEVAATNVVITDSISQYLQTPQYSWDRGSWNSWLGALQIGTLQAGEKRTLYLRSTARTNAPSRVFNAATVTSPVFDPEFNWDDVHFRNVDTASVAISSDLMAIARLHERFDNQPFDNTIGACDLLSFLSAEESQSIVGIDRWEWSPRNLVTNPNEPVTRFTHALSDTTVTFVLTVSSGEQVSTTTYNVNFSPKVVADAGGDRKLNRGEPLVIDATNSQGADAVYQWFVGGTPYGVFEDGNILRPIVYETGRFSLTVTDKHGCSALDEVTIRENDLFAVSDFIILIANDTLTARVSTNDYDPNDDKIYYTGVVFNGPFHGKLLDNPPLSTDKSANFDVNKIAADGTFVYVPNLDYTGFDYFSYEVCDNNGPDLCITGYVYIKVIDVKYPNSPPIANHDYFFVNLGNTLYANVLHNDYDFDGGIITLTGIVEQPTKGSLSYDQQGNIIYVPFGNESGLDYFTYRICDNGHPVECDESLVTINIHKLIDENQRPVAVDDAFFSVKKAIRGNVLNNDYDPNGDEFRLNPQPVSGPNNGTLILESDGSFLYTANYDFEGTDQFVYEITETRTLEQYSAFATVYITNLSVERYTTDVSIVKTGPPYALSGMEIEYAITVTIEGPTLANDIAFIDTISSQLSNYRYSYDQVNWNRWNIQTTIDQMMLYDDTTIYIRATIPDIYTGSLLNTAYVDHAMNEHDDKNNRSDHVIEVYQRLIANAGIDVTVGACEITYQLDGTSSLGVPDMQYRWFPPELLDNPNSPTPLFTTQPGESREFMLVITSNIGGQIDHDTAYVMVSVDPRPVSMPGRDVWPDNSNPVTLNGSASTGIGPLKYTWWVYDSEKNVVVIGDNPEITVDRSNDFYLTITDKHGCTDTEMVHVGYPVDDFIAIDDYITTLQQLPVDIYPLRNDLIDEDDEFNLDLFFVLDYPKNGQLVANPFDSAFTYIPNDYYFGLDSFTYVISTRFGNDQATVYIEVKERKPFVPQGFSPNGDGRNDYLLIEHIELYPKNKLTVFNRWGNIVYHREVYNNAEPWDGVANRGIRIGSGPLPTGAYLYILDLGDDRVSDRYLRGNIYIASDNRR
jgi:gliding motility-associated-like protein/uncharacterized repeat protein (TIGR01451 family)